jgi:hypothetical protein
MNTGKQDLIDEKGEAAAAASEKKRPGSLLAPPPGTNKQHQVAWNFREKYAQGATTPTD